MPAIRDLAFPAAALAGFCAVALYIWSGAPHDGLQHCVQIGDDHARLACYDDAVAHKPPAKGALAPEPSHLQPGTRS